jgi:hypothetical protein
MPKFNKLKKNLNFFFNNGNPIFRIHTLCDFGYVALDIGQLIDADAGTYTCKVKNKLGEASSSITLSISGHDSLDTSSVRPEGLEKIKALEAKQGRRAEEEVIVIETCLSSELVQESSGVGSGVGSGVLDP